MNQGASAQSQRANERTGQMVSGSMLLAKDCESDARVPSNYRMKRTRLGHRFSRRPDSAPSPGRLAEARLGLQLMPGR